MIEDILCDPCFTKLKFNEDFEFCKECQDMVDRYCFRCDTVQSEPVDHTCDSCIEEMNRQYNPVLYTVDGHVTSKFTPPTEWEYPEI